MEIELALLFMINKKIAVEYLSLYYEDDAPIKNTTTTKNYHLRYSYLV